MNYDWYTIKEGSDDISQGDIIKECPVPFINEDKGDVIEADIMYVNGIVLTQTCDIVYNKVDSIIVCPITTKKEYEENQIKLGKNRNEINNNVKGIIKGQQPAYHIINKCEINGFQEDFCIINFKSIYSIPINIVKDVIKDKKRICLCPPYREHLSQAFARYFMRVGLPIPVDIS